MGSLASGTSEKIDDNVEYFKTPGEGMHRNQSLPERRVNSRYRTAVLAAVANDAIVRKAIVEAYGFSIQDVLVTNDRKKLFVLWDCFPHHVERCQRTLEHIAFRVRRSMAANLKAKHTPYLEFKHDRMTASEAAVAAILDRIEREIEDRGD